MFCGNCGMKLNEGAAFCPNCGTPVPAENAAPTEEVKKPAETAPAPAAAPTEEVKKSAETAPAPAAAPTEEVKKPAEPAPAPAAAPTEEVKKPEEKKPKKKDKAAVIVLVVILLLVIGVGAGVGIYFTSDGYNIKKNLKQAQQCFEEQEYEEALEYYDQVLDLDDTLTDAYLKSADIYVLQHEYENAIEILVRGRKRTRELEEAESFLVDKLAEVYQGAADYYAGLGSYSQAYAMLEEGIAETGKQTLTDSLEEMYLKEAGEYLAKDNYYMARDVLQTGASATGSSALSEKLVETYSREADHYLSSEDYYNALWILNDGINVTGDVSLTEKKTDVYIQWADYYAAQGYYQDALWVLNEGLEATGDVSLAERRTAVYTQWAESYKEEGDYAGALALLDEGLEATGDASLTEQKTHLQEHLQLVKSTAYSGSRVQLELEFDEAGNLIKSFSYSYGSLSEGEELEYDASGRMVTRKTYSDGVLAYIITYDEEENPKEQTWFNQYGEETDYASAAVEHDEAGKVTWLIWSGGQNNMTEKVEYLYDDAGNFAGVRRYTNDDVLWSETGYEKDAISKMVTYNEDGSVYRQTEYTYTTSESGRVNPASIVISDGEGNVDSWLKYEYEYDAMGNVATATCYYGYGYNYDETLSSGYYNYQWTYTNEYRYTGE